MFTIADYVLLGFCIFCIGYALGVIDGYYKKKKEIENENQNSNG